jgi:predicted transcriptional regulator
VIEEVPPGRGMDAVQQFVERFAAVMIDAGVPRMPARVFVALLATDSGRLTVAELATMLRVSPAAISGAVRYLIHVGLASRERDPGSRRDHYRVYDDAWYEALVRRDEVLIRMANRLREGIDALGPDTAAGHRIAESLAFVDFIQEELPGLFKRWQQRKASLADGSVRTPEAATVQADPS